MTRCTGPVALLLPQWTAVFIALAGPISPAHGASTAVIRVSNADELVAALDPQNAHRRIHVLHGDYAVTRPLLVPDGTILEGDGVMQVVDGLPAGFKPGTETTLRVTSAFEGDLLTLGDGAVVRNFKVVDLATSQVATTQRSGNVIVVGSRGPVDRLAAEIRDCEIVNPHPFGVAMDGPTGHALVVLTRNPARGGAPPPHEGATVAIRVVRSILRATGGGGAVFAINFAARGNVSVGLYDSRLEGPLIATGGASRPELVSNAVTTIDSTRNLYVLPAEGSDGFGWQVMGGSSAHIPDLASAGASFNTARVHSVDDRIEGFRIGIVAAAGRRWLDSSGPVSDNRLDLDLEGLRIRTEGADAADLEMQGARSEAAQDIGREFPAGDRNTLHVRMHGVTGSPTSRANQYDDAFGPSLQADCGTGNRLEIAGTPADFARVNTNISAAPPVAFFAGGR
jgi:hypothetical protein